MVSFATDLCVLPTPFDDAAVSVDTIKSSDGETLITLSCPPSSFLLDRSGFMSRHEPLGANLSATEVAAGLGRSDFPATTIPASSSTSADAGIVVAGTRTGGPASGLSGGSLSSPMGHRRPPNLNQGPEVRAEGQHLPEPDRSLFNTSSINNVSGTTSAGGGVGTTTYRGAILGDVFGRGMREWPVAAALERVRARGRDEGILLCQAADVDRERLEGAR